MQFKACTVIFYLSLQNLPSAVCLLGSLNNVQGDKSMALLCDSAKGLKKENKVFFPFFFFFFIPIEFSLLSVHSWVKRTWTILPGVRTTEFSK